MNADLYKYTKFPKKKEYNIIHIRLAIIFNMILFILLKFDKIANSILLPIDLLLIVILNLAIGIKIVLIYINNKSYNEFLGIVGDNLKDYESSVKDFCKHIQKYFDKFQNQDIMIRIKVFEDHIELTHGNEAMNPYIIKYEDVGFENLTCVETYIVAFIIKKHLQCGILTTGREDCGLNYVTFDKKLYAEKNLKPWNRTYLHD